MLVKRWDGLLHDRRVLWLLLIALSFLAAATLWGFLDYQRLINEMAVEAEQRATQLAAVRIRDELDEFPSSLVALAHSSAILSQEPERIQEALRKAPAIREGLFDGGIIVLNSFGVVTATEPARPELLQQDRSSRPYFRDLLNNSPSNYVYSDAQSDGPAGAPVIVVSVPIIDGEGRFTGALAGLLRLSQPAISPYYATLVKLRVSPDGVAYVVDGSNRILFDSASLHNGEQYTSQSLPATDAATTARTLDDAGRELLISYAPIPNTPWTLVIEKDWESVAAPTKLYANLLLALLGLGAVLPLAALLLHVRQERTPRGSGRLISRESHLAHRIDHALLPEPAPIIPGWEVAIHREPAPATGRVFYDLLLGIDGCLTLIVAETSQRGTMGGDGVAETLAMITARTLLRSAARSLLPPAQALERTNALLCPDLPPGSLITCLYSRLDPVTGALAAGNANQVRPVRLAGGEAHLVGGKDAPLGLQYDSTYAEYAARLAECDVLFCCSSEVLNATNAEDEPFGRLRLEQVLRNSNQGSKQRIAAVTDALRQFAGGKWANDRDAILIVLERLDTGAAPAQMQ